MIKQYPFKSSNTVQNILSRALIISVAGVFVIAFITASYLSFKSSQLEQINNRKKIHEVMTGLIVPPLVISDTTEVRKLLSLVSTPDEFFGVVNQEGDLFLHDYNQIGVNSLKIPLKKVTGCDQIQNSSIIINNKKYKIFCTTLYSNNIEVGVNKANQNLGILISFSNSHAFIFTGQIFIYFISIAFFTLLMMVFLIRIILQEKFLKPLVALKNKISIKALDPINGQPELGNIGSVPYDIEEIKYAFEVLLRNLKNEVEKRNEADRRSALYDLAAQVAHDIRSPLAALDMTTRILSDIPEDQRLLIRNATQRINDIANNLLQLNKNDNLSNQNVSSYENSLLISLLESIISEKRAQFLDSNVTFDLNIADGAHTAFAKINSVEFKRMMSNIINNSVEAIVQQNGHINVSLRNSSNNAIIEISDNGCGMPQAILEKVFVSDISFGKKGGHGLGLQHSHNVVKLCGGNIQISSEVDIGTTVTISIPLVRSPLWFVDSITISSDKTIVVFDDDSSIHQVWMQRFSNFCENGNNLNIQYFFSSTQLKNYLIQINNIHNSLFLIDYEILKSKKSGLDLIEELGINKQSILVTSRYEEKEIIERCEKLSVRMMPKSMSAYISINYE